MADTRPTPIRFFEAIRLCWLLLVKPKRFLEVQAEDKQARNNYSGRAEREPSALVVRRAFLRSFLLILASVAFGFVAGAVLGRWLGCAHPALVSWLQIGGASLLLWGTLFVCGWDIQTYAGVTLTERVNQWLYRFLYCIGTAVLVGSLAWPQCAK